jgi:hypothetical protein
MSGHLYKGKLTEWFPTSTPPSIPGIYHLRGRSADQILAACWHLNGFWSLDSAGTFKVDLYGPWEWRGLAEKPE